jgi:hypothetical protein
MKMGKDDGVWLREIIMELHGRGQEVGMGLGEE